MSFNLLQGRTNASVLQHLANAKVTISGVVVPGIFRSPSSVAQVGTGAADTAPTVVVASDFVPDDVADQLVEIDGVPYEVINPAPDGTGLTTLTLERA